MYSCDSDQLKVTQRRDGDGLRRHNINCGYSGTELKVPNETIGAKVVLPGHKHTSNS